MNAIKALALAQARGGGVTVEALSVSENGVYTAGEGKAYSPVTVDVPTPTAVQENDVVFLDYDGTIVASYSAADFASLDALPENPSHEGLTAQGWNWTLAGAKAYVAGHGRLFIGQSYITSDGKTRVHIRLGEYRLSPYLGIAVSGTATVDWGDGCAAETVTGSDLTASVNARHTYAAPGDYVIAIEVVTGSVAIIGDNNIGSHLLWKTVTESAKRQENAVYISAIRKLEVGANCAFDTHALSKCYSLEAVTIPTSMSALANNTFVNCSRLGFVTIPYGMTSIAKYSFQSCNSMKWISMSETVTRVYDACYLNCINVRTVAIPDGVTNLDTNAFQGMNCLEAVIMPDALTAISNYVFSLDTVISGITIPASVTSIGNYAFQTCWGLKEIHFKPSTPPALGNSACLANLPTDCVIYVPSGKLADYTSASYYPDSGTYTYVEE